MSIFLSTLIAMTAASTLDKRPMTVDDLLAVKGVSDPQVSPDSKHVVYVVSEIDREANKTNTSLWLVPVEGGEPKRLTTTPGTNNHPRWSPDGKQVAFVSSRGGSSQVWLLPIDGGEPRQVTKLPIDVDGPIWSPKGDQLAFAAEVYPGTSPEETMKRDKEKGDSKSKVRTYENLMIRHWNAWDEQKRSHLFVCDLATGEAKDLIPDWKANVPPKPFGGSEEYCWSPDGKELAFTSEPLENHANSTNTDIWIVPAKGGEPTNFTATNEGADAQPAYFPDSSFKILAFLSQSRAGFEADQWVLKVAKASDAKQTYAMTERINRSILSFKYTDQTLFAVLDDGGDESVVSIPLGIMIDGVVLTVVMPGDPRPLVTGGANTSVAAAPAGETFVFLHNDAAHPAEIQTAKADGKGRTQLTRHNDALLEKLDLNPAERFTFSGAEGDQVQGWLVKPPGFEPKRKYPVVFLIHGGPQGAWHDEWHNRWNYELFAAPGYCVLAINPRGSTGFGQKFTDQISRDWNGKVYEDLMKGLDHALQAYPFLDNDRMAALGGSYGGYMVNWIAGHSDRFKALISHAGIFDLTSMNVTTEELWFSTWEFGGMPWETPELHRDQSPSTFAAKFKTPTLVIHGALDFRVPDAQGLSMFTALQKQGVPSRYVWFPDEGHWILKPANRVEWWKEVHAWLAKYLKDADKPL